jgi:PAT family beta-lactamase induction signal transducer AmpG
MFLPGIVISGFSGQIVSSMGWSSFFFFAAAMGIPSILCSILIVRRGWNEQQ